MLIRRSLVPVALLLALSAGCANNTDSTQPGAAPAPAESSVAIPESGAVSTPVDDPTASGKPGDVTTLTGTVTAGVEPGCMLLDGHLLVFGDAAQKGSVKAGDQITVTGTPAEGMMTTCQQGTPFKVTSVAAG
jgi:hypothetical protein